MINITQMTKVGSSTILEDDSEVKEVNRQRKGFDPIWLQSKVDDQSITVGARDNILNMATLLEQYYPEQWDIQIRKKGTSFILQCSNETYGIGHDYEETTMIETYDFIIMVNYPSISITNGSSKSHNITDLIVRIFYSQNTPDTNSVHIFSSLSEENILNNPSVLTKGYICHPKQHKISSGMQGQRLSMTTNEYNSGYLHSHLHTKSGPNNTLMWISSNFCMGEGEIIQIFQMIEVGYTPELFTMLLIMMGNFVKWESREGSPYIYFSNIRGAKPLPKYPTLRPSVIMEYIDTLKATLLLNPPQPHLLWEQRSDLMRIIENDDFELFVRISDNYKDYPDGMILWRDTHGYYDRKSLESNAIPTGVTTNTILFRGEEVGLSIIIPVTIELSDDFFIHPEIKQIIKVKLENYANYEKTRQDIVRRANQIANEQRSLQQNNVPM